MGRSPSQAPAAVHVDLLGGTPFDPGGEPEAALDGSQGCEAIAEERPTTSLWGGRLARHPAVGRQSGIVMGFAVVHQNSRTGTGLEMVI